METFNEQLGNLLVHCRETAIDEICSEKRYKEIEREQSEIRAELEAISPEAEKLIARYTEALAATQSMELNRILLCGLTLSSELKKYFDSSTPEYGAFAKDFIGNN